MAEHTRKPFVLRHPMSLGDAFAALFRAKPKRVTVKVEWESEAAQITAHGVAVRESGDAEEPAAEMIARDSG
ncbi:MAG TPA: hypothetical protein VGJ21_25275 [Terracidiphilus sp.]